MLLPLPLFDCCYANIFSLLSLQLAGEKWPWPEISLGAWKRLDNQKSKK